MNSSKTDRTLNTWLALLAEYNFDVTPIKSKENKADYLSRVYSLSSANIVENAQSSTPTRDSEDLKKILASTHSKGHFVILELNLWWEILLSLKESLTFQI